MINLELKRKWLTEYAPLLLAAIGILSTGIIFKQAFIELLPLCISLFVMLFNSRANRIGFVIGGINCFIYCSVFFLQKLYTTALSSAFGGIIAFISFFTWKKRAYGSSTVFRKMSNRMRLIGGVLFIIVWGIAAFILSKTNANQYILDSLTGLIGFVCPFLTMYGFIEDLPLYTTNCFLALFMWILIAIEDVASISFVVYNAYCCYMGVKRAICWMSLYKEQNAKKG